MKIESNMKKYILWAVAFVCSCLPLTSQAQHTFSFHDGAFVIAQFTDIHWAPQSEKCAQTAATIRSVLKTEQPDLAVLTGDIVTDTPPLDGWKAIIRLFEECKMPFIVTMGNHDAEFLPKDSIYDLLMTSPYYAGTKGPRDISGCGNCIVPVYGSKQRDKVEALLYCIDSNDYHPNKFYGAYDWIHFDQIAWYRKESAAHTAANGGKPLPSLAFFHIPLCEQAPLTKDDKTFGNALEGGVASSEINSGLFASLADMGDVMGAFNGHDHDNDYIGIFKGIALGYGRVSGWDAYGDMERGARIIRLYEGQFKFDSWITTAKGREDAYYYPSGLNEKETRTLPYLPALNVSPKKNGVAYTYREGNCEKVADVPQAKVIKQGILPRITIAEAAASDHFAYEFRTWIEIPERGVYRFYTYSDDGSVLSIDGQEVVNNDGGHSARRAEGKVALEKGFHELKVTYFEDYMGETLEVGFSGRNLPETVLPDRLLFVPEK